MGSRVSSLTSTLLGRTCHCAARESLPEWMTRASGEADCHSATGAIDATRDRRAEKMRVLEFGDERSEMHT
ncbi:hypothetical protein NEOLEDRAFT_1140610 [Neolentinus lepideus HHB14362 ss-1]|uniref:Uncharacterized protein n=1 Tax=Neolentinus lepideus HHB14362 ss-1 TaxID=1314782 RepID=A0A165P4F0_9AGAM|nr:hypothetical protein NEOLEDRAFT_1140610 [Neolentinus lepideus HHB14362 ss-1]